MKKIYLLLVVALTAFTTQAQVDRSVMPQAGPMPEINLQEPQRFELKNGLKVLVVENHKLPRVTIQLAIDNPPVLEGDKAGVTSFVSSLLGNGSQNISKDAFNEEVDFLGASISFGSTSAFASSLSKYFPRILELMADAAINPNFTQEEFDKEKEKILTGLKSQEKDVAAISGRVQSALAYGTNHPYGEFTSEETVNNVALKDVMHFYDSYFVPANAYLVVIGDVDFKEVKKLVKQHFTSWTKATPPSVAFSNPVNPQYTQINFVDVPNAVQSEVSVQNLVTLKQSDSDYLSALMANKILGGGGEARLFRNLREDKAYTYGSYSSIGNNKNVPSRFRAYASVRNAVTDSAAVQLLEEISKIVNEPVSEKELEDAKATYTGNFIMALERPQTIANYALNIETEGLPKDYYKTYLSRINAISVADVQNAAKKYFDVDNARVIVTGKGSEVLENLEKVSFNGKTLPVMYFDKFANKTEKPNYEAAIPDGVTATSVLQKYVDAIGGNEKLASVQSYTLQAEGEVQGMALNLEIKRTVKDQFMQDLKVMGNSMSKQVFNGDSGYMIAQGQRIDMSDDEAKKVRQEAVPFPELGLLAGGATLEGMETVNDKKAYAVRVSENKVAFYDVETGFKLQEVTTQEMQGQKIQSTLAFDNYQDVSGIMFPFVWSQQMGPQTIDLTVKEVKVNEGVTDADFN